MSNYLKLFEKTNEYNQYIEGDSFLLPNVSHTEDTLKVYYNPMPPHDYSKDYFTIVVIEGSHIDFDVSLTDGVSYSKDNGETWDLCDSEGIDVSEGDNILVKCVINGSYGSKKFINSTDNTFKAKIQGNIMSLLLDDNFMGVTVLENIYLNSLFKNSEWLIDAQNLVLPATTLVEDCYENMFVNCTNLVYAPKILPAMTLENANNCYNSMFYGCSSLITTPELPATSLENADNCYNSMFYGCSSLVTAPELPAETLASRCYQQMFSNCSNLVYAPKILPAMTLKTSCYSSMFSGCSSLITAPELPAEMLASGCYSNMFRDCTNLVYAPELPATSLEYECYYRMFRGCTNLVYAPKILPAETLAERCYQGMFGFCSNLVYVPKILPAETLAADCYHGMFLDCRNLVYAPVLPATKLVSYCYVDMFSGCNLLIYVKAMFTTHNPAYTNAWLSVTSTGTFVGNIEAGWLDNVERTNSTVPKGWTIVKE